MKSWTVSEVADFVSKLENVPEDDRGRVVRAGFDGASFSTICHKDFKRLGIIDKNVKKLLRAREKKRLGLSHEGKRSNMRSSSHADACSSPESLQTLLHVEISPVSGLNLPPLPCDPSLPDVKFALSFPGFVAYKYMDTTRNFEIHTLGVFTTENEALSYCKNVTVYPARFKPQRVAVISEQFDAIWSGNRAWRVGVARVTINLCRPISSLHPGQNLVIIYKYTDSPTKVVVTFHGVNDDMESAVKIVHFLSEPEECEALNVKLEKIEEDEGITTPSANHDAATDTATKQPETLASHVQIESPEKYDASEILTAVLDRSLATSPKIAGPAQLCDLKGLRPDERIGVIRGRFWEDSTDIQEHLRMYLRDIDDTSAVAEPTPNSPVESPDSLIEFLNSLDESPNIQIFEDDWVSTFR